MASKPKKHDEYKEVIYSSSHWTLLAELREKAMRIMSALDEVHLYTLVHGSLARGDVNKNSDVDVFIAEPQSSFLVETTLERAKVPVNARVLIQATPNYAMKAYIEADTELSVSFPLMSMRRVEREFYRFSGEINFNQIRVGARVAGVNKRLMLIDPTAKGHAESSIINREETVAKRLGISTVTVLDRVHALLKRDEVGRTGVFIKRKLAPDETFELAMKKLADENPAVRRRIR